MIKSFQFINWFPEFIGFGFKRLNLKETDMALIYEWNLWLGFFEIRKWTKE